MWNAYPEFALGNHIRRLATSPLKSNQPIQFVLRAKAIHRLDDLSPGRHSGAYYAQQPLSLSSSILFEHSTAQTALVGTMRCSISDNKNYSNTHDIICSIRNFH